MSEPAHPSQVVILVGGRGTRLGDLTRSVPKPLMPVADRPFLDWLIDEVVRFGIPRITLLAGHLGEQIISQYHGRQIGGAHIEVLTEPQPLGTAGGLRLFAARLAPRFLLMNGDTRFDVNLLDLHLHADTALGTLALRRTASGGRYGTVMLAQDGTVTGFLPSSKEHDGPINGGIYLLDRAIIDWVGEGAVSMEAEVFPRLAAARLLRGTLYDGQFIDIGVPEDLARGQTEIPAMACRPAAFLASSCLLVAEPNHDHDPARVRWIAGAEAALKRLNDAGYFVFVVVDEVAPPSGKKFRYGNEPFNQAAIASLADAGAHIDAFAYRCDNQQATIDEYLGEDASHKPDPGIIEGLCATWPVKRAASFLIDDKLSYLSAAKLAGLSVHLFTRGDLLACLDTILTAAGREATAA